MVKQRMKALATWLLVSLAAGCCSGCNVVRGSGVATEETRDVATFWRVEARGVARLQLFIAESDAATMTLTVRGDDNLVPLLVTQVTDGTLLVESEPGYQLNPKVPLEVSALVPDLNDIQADDDVFVLADGINNAQIGVAGRGSAYVNVGGQTGTLNVYGIDSASINTSALLAESVQIQARGSSAIEVCAETSLNVMASGSARVAYTCGPDEINEWVDDSASLTGY